MGGKEQGLSPCPIPLTEPPGIPPECRAVFRIYAAGEAYKPLGRTV